MLIATSLRSRVESRHELASCSSRVTFSILTRYSGTVTRVEQHRPLDLDGVQPLHARNAARQGQEVISGNHEQAQFLQIDDVRRNYLDLIPAKVQVL